MFSPGHLLRGESLSLGRGKRIVIDKIIYHVMIEIGSRMKVERMLRMDKLEGQAKIYGCSVQITWDGDEQADGYFLMSRDEFGIYKQLLDINETNYYMNLAVARRHHGFLIAPYKESAGEKHIISQSRNIEMPEIKSESMRVRSLRSYHGVTLSWIDEKTTKGNYYVWKLQDNSFSLMGYAEEHQITLNQVEEGDCFVIASVKTDKEGKTECVKLSEEYVYSGQRKEERQDKKVVSVVVPVYNNEHYVARCLDALLLSTLSEMEVVVVDDGSKDASGGILDWYQREYPDKVVVIHQENSGVAAARNTGTAAARGEYIGYVDSDDIVHPQMYEKLYCEASALDCDIAASQYFRYSAKNGRILRYKLPCEEHKAHDVIEMLRRIYSEGFGTVAIWNKLYRAALVKERPIPKMLNEDTSWTPYILSHAKSFCFVAMPLYCWDRRVECTKVTLSNELSAESPEEKYEIRRKSFEYFLQNGNQEKIECLSYCAVKRIIQCAEKYPKKNSVNPYCEYVKELEERYLLSKNAFLLEDAEYLSKVTEILEIR